MALILAVNAGSSSLKLSVFRQANLELVLNSSISSISSPPAVFSFGLEEPTKEASITDHASAFAHFLSRVDDKEKIEYICHRVVHGGDYTRRVVIDQASYHHIENLSDLAPLHNGAALSVIKACLDVLPAATSVAYFDSAFHTSIPPHISSYPINQEIARARGLKKYGFHGLSYAFVLRAVSDYLGIPAHDLSLIVLHLGSGASACAIRNGRSLDTSMGLTPLSGLPGATRAGTVDPSLIFHYTNTAGKITHDPAVAVDLHVTHAEDILNRQAGWKALTGTTDFHSITQRAYASGDDTGADTTDISSTASARLAFDLFVDRILDYVGAYHLKLAGRVHALIFVGGIGERSVELRAAVAERIACLGYDTIDPTLNEKDGDGQGAVRNIGIGAQERRILICKTDEQLEMARGCAMDKEFWA